MTAHPERATRPRRHRAVMNPLGVAFGLVLKQLRDAHKLKVWEVANRTDSSPSNVRMLEIGQINLQPARVIGLAEAFPALRTEALAAFIVVTESIWSDPATSDADFCGRLRRVVDLFPAFAPVAEILRQMWRADGIPPQRGTEPKIVGAVRNFLTQSPTHGTEDAAAHYSAAFTEVAKKVSPLLLDAIVQHASTLQGLKVRLTARELYDFEHNNWHRIKECVAVLRDPELFVDTPSYGGVVGYRYLLRSEFRKFSVLAINGPSPRKITERFLRNLYNAFSEQRWLRNEQEFEQVRSKIDIRNAASCRPAPNEAKAIMQQILTHGERSMRHFWLYTLGESRVAFIDNASAANGSKGMKSPGGEPTGEVLDLPEAMKREALIAQLLQGKMQ